MTDISSFDRTKPRKPKKIMKTTNKNSYVKIKLCRSRVPGVSPEGRRESMVKRFVKSKLKAGLKE